MNKVFHCFLLSIISLLSASFMISPAAAAAPTPEPATCADAEAYLHAGELTPAEQVFDALLAANPFDKCSLDGLQQVALLKCAAAQKRAEGGDVEGARTAYTALLESRPDLQCALDGLVSLPSKFDEVSGLVQVGDEDAAWTALGTAIAANPRDPDLSVLAAQPWAQRSAAKEAWDRYGLPLAAAILTAVLVILASVWYLRNSRLTLDIGDFDPGAISRKPPSEESPIAGKLVTARFETELMNLEKSSRIDQPHVIDAPVSAPAMPASLGSIPAEAGVLWDFFTKLFPPNVLTVKGTLDYDKPKGAGLNIKVIHNRRNELWGSFIVWQKDIDPGYKPSDKAPETGDFLALVPAAAIYTYWAVCQRTLAWWPGRSARSLRSTFGTDDAESFILTRVGADKLQCAADPQALAQSERILRLALTEDRENASAWFNLAMVESRRVDERISNRKKGKIDPEHEYTGLKKILNQVLRITSRDPASVARILANYNLGITELYLYLLTADTDRPAGNLAEAKKRLREAIQGAKDASRKSGAVVTDGLVAMLQIAYADALMLSGECKTYPPEELRRVIESNFVAPWILYNLACDASTMVQFKIIAEAKAQEQALDEALGYLRDVLATNPVYARYALHDVSLATLRKRKDSQFRALMQGAKACL